MGVYIKGKRKPGTCYDCDFVDGSDDCFFGLGYTGDMRDCVYEDCPLIEVTEPHGRFVDIDEVLNYTYKNIDQMTKIGVPVDSEYKWHLITLTIENTPTVIEAEGE